MKVKYIGPALDFSGYGEACRHDIGALDSAGIDLFCEVPRYTLELSNYGKLTDLVNKYRMASDTGYDVIIMHITPNLYGKYYEKGKYHIGRVFWETDKLPKEFADSMQYLDEIWTGSEYNANAIRKAGVTKPIRIITEAIDIEYPKYDRYKSMVMDDFTFYSIFEWTERKNPIGLLRAYWEEFKDNENVSLILKVYIDNFTTSKKKEIESYMNLAKIKVHQESYPRTYILNKLMTRDQIYRLHQTYDCFVSAHRGEGWGVPQMEAMLVGNPIISTNCGGIHEYLANEQDAYLPGYNLVPLRNNNRNQQWYTQDQNWGEVDIEALKKYMRFVYENKDIAKQVAANGQKLVNEKFSFKAVGQEMLRALQSI